MRHREGRLDHDRLMMFHPLSSKTSDVVAAAMMSGLGACRDPAPLQAEQNQPSAIRERGVCEHRKHFLVIM